MPTRFRPARTWTPMISRELRDAAERITKHAGSIRCASIARDEDATRTGPIV